MAYSETIETTKYPPSSSTRYCRFNLDISCETLASQTGYIDFDYELDFYSRNSGGYGGQSTPPYRASDVVFSINEEVVSTGAGPYYPTGYFSSTIDVSKGRFRVFLDENGAASFDMSITATLRAVEDGSPIDYSYTLHVTRRPSGTLRYVKSGNIPSYDYLSDAYVKWTLEGQNVLTNSSNIKMVLTSNGTNSAYDYNYYAKITPLNGPNKNVSTILTVKTYPSTSVNTTISLPHPTNTSEIARFRMEVGFVPKSGGSGGSYYPGGGGGSTYNAATTEEYILPKIFRNIAEVYVGDGYKGARVYIYKNGAWRRAQPYVFTDGSYVSA